MELPANVSKAAQEVHDEPAAKRGKSAKKQVLVVTDMQKDYDTSANKFLYGEVKSPYANDIRFFVPVVFTYDWLSSKELAGRTPFCLENSEGAELLDGLEVDKATDIMFKKNSDDSFCDEGGRPEDTTNCSQLSAVLAKLGLQPANTALVFVGQRFERCVLKSVAHAQHLGYESTIVDAATFTKTQVADPEWNLEAPESLSARMPKHSGSGIGAVPDWAADIYLRARKSAGRCLAESYLKTIGVKIITSWPEPHEGVAS